MIIFDLDGVLADCKHRRHFVSPPVRRKYLFTDVDDNDGFLTLKGDYENEDGTIWKPDYKAYDEACDKDSVIKQTRYVFTALSHFGEQIQIWSGRCKSVKEKTLKWLDEFHVMPSLHLFAVKMRPIGNNEPDEVLKGRWLEEHIAGDGEPIQFVFDDRPKMFRFWRSKGIFVFNCAQHDREF